jgi:hypothetical protein
LEFLWRRRRVSASNEEKEQDTGDNDQDGADQNPSSWHYRAITSRRHATRETSLARLLFLLSLASFGLGSLAEVLAGSPLFRRLLGAGICPLFELVGLPL